MSGTDHREKLSPDFSVQPSLAQSLDVTVVGALGI